MKTPQKLLAVFGIACAVASSQANLAGAPNAALSGAQHESPLLSARALESQPSGGAPILFFPDETLPLPRTWTDGADFPPQWRQLMDSLDAHDWRLGLGGAMQAYAPDWRAADPAAASVPEPAGYLALLAGLAGMALLRRTQMKSITGE